MMKKVPFVVDLEEGMKFFYVTGADNQYHKVPGQRVIVRLAATQRQEEVLRLAIVVVGHDEKGVHTAIIDEKSGSAFFEMFYISDEKFNDPDYAPVFLSEQITKILHQEDSIVDLLDKLEATRQITRRDYGPLPADHGQPAN